MNFILRNVSPDKKRSHTKFIGPDYQVVNRFEDYDEFGKLYEKQFGERHVADLDTESTKFSTNTYAFLICNEGSVILPLSKDDGNYIMTENGSTFANISYK